MTLAQYVEEKLKINSELLQVEPVFIFTLEPIMRHRNEDDHSTEST